MIKKTDGTPNSSCRFEIKNLTKGEVTYIKSVIKVKSETFNNVLIYEISSAWMYPAVKVLGEIPPPVRIGMDSVALILARGNIGLATLEFNCYEADDDKGNDGLYLDCVDVAGAGEEITWTFHSDRY